MTRKDLSVSKADGQPDVQARISNAISQAVLDIAGHIPHSETTAAANPLEAAQALTRTAANKAATVSGSLALAPGPFGLLTVLPDLVAVWRIQSQLVSDIAALYGQSATLSKEHMLFCLFKHSAAQAVRDLSVRAGERWLIRQASGALMQTIAKRLGVRLSQKLLGSGVARFLPILGAVGVGGYAYYDTTRVAASAIELFGAVSPPTQRL
jgi:EcsC protein family